jgi:hypothetical protein
VKIEKFIELAELAKQSEADRACLLAFYDFKKTGFSDFNADSYVQWIDGQNFSIPNKSRLNKKLKASTKTVRGAAIGTFMLRHDYLKELEAKFPQLSVKSQDVIDDGTILPLVLYDKTRGYIESLAKQINASYENNIFDGCAVLMRRLEEVLLIMAYEKLSIEAAIKDPATGTYYMLEKIVANAAGNGTLNLSRNARTDIEVFRELGNYSAHKITYLCRREYIQEKIDKYRALIDELLHKAGLRT